ncbi:dihydrofolate reductase family protein [Catellatospora methionotrophica]|uniref:dihydrofolate reductase family protein n=1 Tax=Catellatospora methionotrophica TaxID=121620 RepID=UPI0033CA8320
MSEIYTCATMSIDGYISGPAESGFEHLFHWYGSGDVEVPTANPQRTLKMSAASAKYFTELSANTGALVVGRKLFDAVNGWGGRHPMNVPVVVLSHGVPDGWPRVGSPFTFVSGGIEEAVAVAGKLAGGRAVGVNGGTIARQCLNAGLLDEVLIDLVPVLLGGGTKFFDQLADAPVVLEGPISTVEGRGVTHLRYGVRRS